MKKLLVCLVFLSGCTNTTPTCPTGQLLGTDNQCYSCTYGSPEYAGNTFGYCGTASGGVSCCSYTYYNYNNITCYASEPWLCSDGLCHSTDTGVCVYAP